MSIDFEPTETAASQSPSPDKLASTISRGGVGSGGYSPTLQTTGTKKTGAALSGEARQVPSHRTQMKVEPRVRQKCRILFGSCIDNANRAIDSDDFFVRNNALEQLKDSLAELWAWRDKREEPFAEVVNLLQGVLLGKSVENLEGFEIAALKSAFLRLHDEPVVTRFVVNEVAFSLMEDGVDVFRPIK